MIQFLYATALFHKRKTAEAKEILLKNGGLELPDVREGAADITTLYQDIMAKEGKADPEIPPALDYRINP